MSETDVRELAIALLQSESDEKALYAQFGDYERRLKAQIKETSDNSDRIRQQIMERMDVGEKRAYLSDDGECVILVGVVGKQSGLDTRVRIECIALEREAKSEES